MKIPIKSEYDFHDLNKPKTGLFLMIKRFLRIKRKGVRYDK